MKKILSIGLVILGVLSNVVLAADSPFEVNFREGRGIFELNIGTIVDDVNLKDVVINRGNCKLYKGDGIALEKYAQLLARIKIELGLAKLSDVTDPKLRQQYQNQAGPLRVNELNSADELVSDFLIVSFSGIISRDSSVYKRLSNTDKKLVDKVFKMMKTNPDIYLPQPLKFGEVTTIKVRASQCPRILEVQLSTDKGVFTHSFR